MSNRERLDKLITETHFDVRRKFEYEKPLEKRLNSMVDYLIKENACLKLQLEILKK